MRQLVSWIFRSVIVSGILGLLLFVLFFILASRDPSRMTVAELLIGIPMVLLWIYFWAALFLGIILKLLSRGMGDKK